MNPPIPLGSLLLAAHAAVLAVLSGERDVVTGYVPAPGAGPLPCPLSAEPGTWRELLSRTRRAEEELLGHAGFPVEELRADSGLTGPRFDAVFDLTGGDLTDGMVLWVGIDDLAGVPALRLRYRTDVLDAAAAARIAGYHLTALARLVTDPDAELDQDSLLSAAEIAFQIDGLAGPRRELPRAPVPRAVRAAGAPAPGRDRRRARRPAVELSGAQRPGQPHRPRPARPRAGTRRRSRGGHRTQPGLDGLGHRDLQSRRRLPADRAAPARRPDRQRLAPRRVHPGAHRTGSTTTLDQALATLPAVRPDPGRDRLHRPPPRRTPPTRTSA